MNDKHIITCLRYLRSLVPFKWRELDAEFWSFLKLLHENERKSYEEVRAYQFGKLQKLVHSAYFNTEFYRKKYDAVGFHPDQLRTWDDFTRIPLLTKDEVRQSSASMVVRTLGRKIFPDHTSGTTGKPLDLYRDRQTLSRDWAAICYQWERVGYSPYDGRVEFRGFMSSNDDYIYFPDHRYLRINIIKMNKNNIEMICKRIRKTGYRFFHGYSSAIYKFALLLRETGITMNPDALMFASENIIDWELKFLDKLFPASRKNSLYGLTEKTALGAWTERREYSFIPTYGIVEHSAYNEELITTGFINEVMPLIRYRTSDVAMGFSARSGDSQRMLFPSVRDIVGRLDDLTYTNDGKLIPAAVPTFPFKGHKHISACKLVQYSLTEFEIMVQAVREQAEQEVEDIKKRLRWIYGDRSHFRVTYFDAIPTDKSGKFRYIECRIKKQ